MSTEAELRPGFGSTPFLPGPSELPARRVFVDDSNEAAWRANGFFVTDGFGAELIGTLRELVEQVYRGSRDGFHSTLQSSDAEYRRAVFERFPPMFEEVASQLFVDYEPFAASLTIKWPGEASELVSHQDWTMVDEHRFRTLNIWCPLVPTSESNGALSALPGSHLLLDQLRCSPTNPHAFRSGANDVPVAELLRIDTELGQAVVFDQGVLHGSGANLIDEWRPAVTVAYKPVEAQLLHHYVPDPSSFEVDVYEVDADFFTQIVIGEPPARPRARTGRFYGTPVETEEILATLAPSVAAGPVRAIATTTNEEPLVHPTFVDPALEEEFTHNGYVVVDLLDDAQLELLRATAEAVFTGEASGMHATNMCQDTSYRRRVFDAICPLLEPIAAPLLVDHETAAAILLMKFPGDGSQFVSHQDWTLVDEERFRAVNVWCPLVDVASDNGTLSVVPGSHRLLRSVRCDPTYPSHYQPPGWDLMPDEMVPLTLRAGQVVVFDLALLHSSPPNRTSSTRSAVALTMKPRAADLLHWYLPTPDSNEMEIFDVDIDFLIDFQLGTRPDYPLVGTAPFVGDDVGAEALRELCFTASVAGAPAASASLAATAAASAPQIDSPAAPTGFEPAAGSEGGWPPPSAASSGLTARLARAVRHRYTRWGR